MDPRAVWLSEHFRLSDFLGNHSVYTKGFRNPFLHSIDSLHIENARALCTHALEPVLSYFGPLSISYGYISDEFSRRTVAYQDPTKPSHHRWDLGAAADIAVHAPLRGLPMPNVPLPYLFADQNTRTSPALLAHALDSELCIPYSRMITYSESPFVCVAVSAREVATGRLRKAFYENEYMGVPRAKPNYHQMASEAQRAARLSALQETGLAHPWHGGGYPSYHGGGKLQYQHTQVSKYTTLLDWVISLKSISNGITNMPNVRDHAVHDAFVAAGLVYDALVDQLGIPRFSIMAGYLQRTHPDFGTTGDWHGGEAGFLLGPPQSYMDDLPGLAQQIDTLVSGVGYAQEHEHGIEVRLDVTEVLGDPRF